MKPSEVIREQEIVRAMLADAGIALAANEEVEVADFGLGHYREEGLGLVVRVNEPEYCSKWLTLLPGQTCPWHFHKLKKETFFVLKGEVHLDAGSDRIVLRPGDRYTIAPGVEHQFSSPAGAVIEEVSTHDENADSYFRNPNVVRDPVILEDSIAPPEKHHFLTAEVFRNTFEQVTQEQLSSLINAWSSQPRFTAYIKSEMMPRLAEILGYRVQTEYKRIDIILTKSVDAGFGELLSIAAAIEHENNFGGSHEEIKKLSMIASDLGVLITYASPHQRPRMLEAYSEIFNHSTMRCGELLVVFGPYGMKPPANLIWEYFKFQDGSFQLID